MSTFSIYFVERLYRDRDNYDAWERVGDFYETKEQAQKIVGEFNKKYKDHYEVGEHDVIRADA